MTQLYVGNLSAEGDEKAIRALFGKYGQVREVLMKNGYAFVEFENPMAAEEAMRELNGEQSSVAMCVNYTMLCVRMTFDVHGSVSWDSVAFGSTREAVTWRRHPLATRLLLIARSTIACIRTRDSM